MEGSLFHMLNMGPTGARWELKGGRLDGALLRMQLGGGWMDGWMGGWWVDGNPEFPPLQLSPQLCGERPGNGPRFGGWQARRGARAPVWGRPAGACSCLPADELPWQPARKKISACDGGRWAAARAAVQHVEPADFSVRSSSSHSPPLPGGES